MNRKREKSCVEQTFGSSNLFILKPKLFIMCSRYNFFYGYSLIYFTFFVFFFHSGPDQTVCECLIHTVMHTRFNNNNKKKLKQEIWRKKSQRIYKNGSINKNQKQGKRNTAKAEKNFLKWN